MKESFINLLEFEFTDKCYQPIRFGHFEFWAHGCVEDGWYLKAMLKLMQISVFWLLWVFLWERDVFIFTVENLTFCWF